MEKRILFINESPENFLIVAMVKSLNAAGYEVLSARPHPRELEFIDNMPDIFIVYLDDDYNRYKSTLMFLTQKLSEPNTQRYLYLIGNPIEIEMACRVIPQSAVAKAFERPVNTSDLITQLDIICTDYSYDVDKNGVEHSFEGAEDSAKRSILLVDDDATLLRSMQSWISKKYNVFITNSGMNTISFLHERTVDLILLDYEMPVLSGLEVFQILKNEPSTADIPVIFLTSKDDKSVVLKVLEAKPESYLLKPMPPSILTRTVDEFFKKQAEEKRYAQKKKNAKEQFIPHPEEELEELESAD